jgi:hypothetical protein
MDFYLTCLPCSDCKLELEEPSLHLIVIRAFELLVASIVDQEVIVESQETKKAVASKNIGSDTAYGNRPAVEGIGLVLGAISAVAETILGSMAFHPVSEKLVCLL